MVHGEFASAAPRLSRHCDWIPRTDFTLRPSQAQIPMLFVIADGQGGKTARAGLGKRPR